MKKIFFITTIILLTLSCNDGYDESDDIDCSSYDYSDCISTEPFDGRMYVKLTINDENKKVPIAIYKGKLEDNVLLIADTATKEYYDTLLPMNDKKVYYTVTAAYHQNGSDVIAIDGDNISKYHSNICDSVCWSVNTGSVNVRLK